jgi:exonuclease SbcD
LGGVPVTRLLHVADLHQGLETHSRPDPRTGIPSAVLDVAGCWLAACSIAAEREVDAVTVAGDVFHGPNPDAVSLFLFERGLRHLESAAIPVLLIAGNHDRAPHAGQPCVLEVFHRPPAVTVSTRPEVVEVGGVRFATLPSVSRHQLMSVQPWLAEGDRSLVEGLESVLSWLRTEGADVLTGHWPVQGSILGNERDISISPEPTLPLLSIEGPWRYAAFGHIHKAQRHQAEAGRTLLAYPGSIDRMNFGEEGERKVALEVDLDPEFPRVGEHDLPARRFLTLDTLTAIGSWRQENVEGAIVRVRLQVEEGFDRDRFVRLQQSLYDAGAHIVRMEVEVQRPVRRRVELQDIPAPLDALETYFEAKGTAEEQRTRYRSLVTELLEEAR